MTKTAQQKPYAISLRLPAAKARFDFCSRMKVLLGKELTVKYENKFLIVLFDDAFLCSLLLI